jgi:hypothetical protein
MSADAVVPGDAGAMADELSKAGKADKPSQSTELVKLAEQRYRFAVADDGRCFAVALDGANIARPLRGTDGLRQELAHAYYEQHKRAPSASALADALAVVEGAAAQADREPLALRVATHGAGVVLDLGTPDGHCVLVKPDGWQLLDRSPVVFRRTELTMPLPVPVRGGRLDRLRDVVNVADESWPLLVGWLVAALLPEVRHPVLLVAGLQGAGKSTAAANVAGVIDPSAAPLQSPPTDVTGWVLSASGSWVVTVDNLSSVPQWLSDSLCRAVTGDGRVARQLYTDNSLSVIALRRCVVLTAIDPGALRGDLAERLLRVELTRIAPDARRTDSELDADYRAMHPEVLGALLDVVARVLAVLPTVDVPVLPRMAEFARVLAAVDGVTGWGSFGTYAVQSDVLAADVVAADVLASAVVDFMGKQTTWTGTPTQLLKLLTKQQYPDDRERRDKQWPKNAAQMTGALKQCTVQLAAVGVVVEHGGTGRGAKKQRSWTLTRSDGAGVVPTAEAPPTSSPADMPPELAETTKVDGGDAGDDRAQPLSWQPLERCSYCRLVTFDPDREQCANPRCLQTEPW